MFQGHLVGSLLPIPELEGKEGRERERESSPSMRRTIGGAADY